MPTQELASEKTNDAIWEANKPQIAPVEAPKEAPKPHGWWENTKAAFQSHMPDWVVRNSSRINQIGLMLGTTVILGSSLRNRNISKDIWAAQEGILKKSGLSGAALEKKIGELTAAKVMKKPGLHMQRVFYLMTAITGLGIGGFLKDKETPEQRAAYKDMPLLNYLGMRLGQAFDPLNHSRQTAGVVGATSGILAMISGFSQPGGALVSEAFVGATLVSGFTGLALINDPVQAKRTLNFCWATRLPFVVTSTYETMLTKPVFTTPLAAELKKTTAYSSGVVKAMQEGVKIPRFGLGMGKFALAGHKTVYGGQAANAFTKKFLGISLPYNRMDISYPVGQWANMLLATFGFLMAGSDEKAKAEAAAKTAPVIDVVPVVKTEVTIPAAPSPKIHGAVQAEERIADAPAPVAAVAVQA